LPYSFVFQPGYDGGSPNFDHSSPPVNISNSGVPAAPHSPCRCAKHFVEDFWSWRSIVVAEAPSKRCCRSGWEIFRLDEAGVFAWKPGVWPNGQDPWPWGVLLFPYWPLLNRLASSCNVSSLKPPCAFCCVPVIFML
jgi:hypothetical protein